MKIILLYGPGEIGKRNEVLRLRKQFVGSVIRLDFKEVGLKNLEMELVSRSLFEAGPRLVIVDNTPDNLDVQTFKGTDENLTLLLVAASPKAESSLMQSVKNVAGKIVPFEGEKELTAFPFLDALIEQRKQALLELHRLLEEYGGMYVLSMIYYLLRRNLLPPPASDFMKKKVNLQKQKYTSSDWQRLYLAALQTEFAIKNGVTSEQLGLIRLTEKIISGKY